MSATRTYKQPVVMHGTPTKEPPAHQYLGFNCEINLCDTIEEALKSFDDLEKLRKGNSSKPFAYKS